MLMHSKSGPSSKSMTAVQENCLHSFDVMLISTDPIFAFKLWNSSMCSVKGLSEDCYAFV